MILRLEEGYGGIPVPLDTMAYSFCMRGAHFQHQRLIAELAVMVAVFHRAHDKTPVPRLGFEVTRRFIAPMGGIGHTVVTDREWERVA